MPGIKRINITNELNGRGAWRFWQAQRRWGAANQVYRDAFDCLADGYEVMNLTNADFEAGYDRFLGIDVILQFERGMEATLQEKFLFTTFRTVTVEYWQNWRTKEPGDWFNMRAQYYFTGYDRKHSECKVTPRLVEQEAHSRICTCCGTQFTFQDWIILNWAQVLLETERGNIKWHERRNQNDGARASFRWAPFSAFPTGCTIAKSNAIKSRQMQHALPF